MEGGRAYKEGSAMRGIGAKCWETSAPSSRVEIEGSEHVSSPTEGEGGT